MSMQAATAASAARPEVVVISQRLGGHAGASGYDRLQEYLDCRLIRPPARWSLAQRAAAKALRPVTRRSGSRWYHRSSLIGEIAAAREWLRGTGRIFHFLYGENSYRYLGRMKSLATRNGIVCTYHTPPEKFAQVVKDRRHIERLDAVIVVSTMQTEFFAGIVGRERVFFVPHGIDVNYFTPGAAKNPASKRFTCLFVGSHLRDVATLARTARLLEPEPDVRFVVVTRPANHAAFAGLGNVDIKTGINDEQLLAVYRDSDILALPLLDATANNSLLEAMACGLPIVSTDLQGVRDYVTRECALLVPPAGAQSLADAIMWLKRDEAAQTRMAQASRTRALELSWENIAQQTVEVYRAVGR
jgi:glycosyltransferase involved in cell wall biosynthesis